MTEIGANVPSCNESESRPLTENDCIGDVTADAVASSVEREDSTTIDVVASQKTSRRSPRKCTTSRLIVCVNAVVALVSIPTMAPKLLSLHRQQTLTSKTCSNPVQHLITNNVTTHLNLVSASDLNGDGMMDIIWSTWNDKLGNKLSWHENLDHGHNFVEHVIEANEARGQNAKRFRGADVNGDGSEDIIFASCPMYNHKISWYENVAGNGSLFVEHVIAESHKFIAADNCAIHVADLNGDGWVDVLSGVFGQDISWFENMGNGSFVEHGIQKRREKSVNHIYSADLTGDGLFDAIIADFNYNISWIENKGMGVFVERNIISTVRGGKRHVAAHDMNNDGFVDVVAVTSGGGEIWGNHILWYENTGNGSSFLEHVVAWDVWPEHSTHLVDLNGDGMMDILSGDGWYENLENGKGFHWHNIYNNTNVLYSIGSADMNGDGTVDVFLGYQEEMRTYPYDWQERISWFDLGLHTALNYVYSMIMM